MDKSISPQGAFDLLKNNEKNCVFVDVRSAAEFDSVHAESAIHVPLEQLGAWEGAKQLEGRKIICICQSGMRGRKAVEELTRLGVENATNIEGGTIAWKSANLPIVRGKQRVSLERQVRITAGALVLIGSVAGLTLSPYLFFVPIFVGAGLLFSGISDTCGMAILLAKCPWNRE